MAEQNDELKMINHLLEVEKDANSLISEAMETSEKKISEARAKYNAEYKEKTEKIIEELKNNYETSINKISEEHNRQIDEYKTYLEAKPQNYDNFAKFLDKKLFEKA